MSRHLKLRRSLALYFLLVFCSSFAHSAVDTEANKKALEVSSPETKRLYKIPAFASFLGNHHLAVYWGRGDLIEQGVAVYNLRNSDASQGAVLSFHSGVINVQSADQIFAKAPDGYHYAVVFQYEIGLGLLKFKPNEISKLEVFEAIVLEAEKGVSPTGLSASDFREPLFGTYVLRVPGKDDDFRIVFMLPEPRGNTDGRGREILSVKPDGKIVERFRFTYPGDTTQSHWLDRVDAGPVGSEEVDGIPHRLMFKAHSVPARVPALVLPTKSDQRWGRKMDVLFSLAGGVSGFFATDGNFGAAACGAILGRTIGRFVTHDLIEVTNPDPDWHSGTPAVPASTVFLSLTIEGKLLTSVHRQ